MDQGNRPRGRVRKVVSGGKGVEKKGQGLGTGPVNNTGNYEERRRQEAARPAGTPERRSGTSPFGRSPFGSAPTGNDSGSSRPAGNAGFPGGFFPPAGSGMPGSGRPSAPMGSGSQQSSQRPSSSPRIHYGSSRPTGSSTGTPSGGSAPNRAGGGGSKLILIVVVLAVLYFGGKTLLGGLFLGTVNVGGQQSPPNADTQQPSIVLTDGNGSGGLTNLLGSLLGSGGSAYDLPGIGSGASSVGSLSSLLGSGSMSPLNGLSQYFNTGTAGEMQESLPSASGVQPEQAVLNQTVAAGARDKYTTVRGGGKDTVTVLVYMCGSDLESRSGMGTADLKEMARAKLSDRVNLIVYTGGASRWKNNVVDARTNQIYQIRNGNLERLKADAGRKSMAKPETLTEFIRYGAENFPADRTCLILWDHGGGSVSGYGRDETVGGSDTMTLAEINTALKNAGVKFDFIGFDACLMATVENGLMLDRYADYMIASEETEPGVGWYYTDWLTALSANTSLPTTEIGRHIADDFVAVCARQCRGQGTTLSVVDLAELAVTVPAELKDFSVSTSEMIQNKQYKQVSSARAKTREFAQSSRIDQVDLVDFASQMGTPEGQALAEAVRGAVKYNRTGGGMSRANGLSIYFPYKRIGSKVNQAVSTYEQIGLDDSYARCIQAFASLEASGQIAAGTPMDSYGSAQSVAMPGLMNSLLGGGYPASQGGADSLDSLLSSLLGGSSGSAFPSGLGFLGGRALTEEETRDYLLENRFLPENLVWENGSITLSEAQWGLLVDESLNVFYDDGEGYLDLGMDWPLTESWQGNRFEAVYDGSWVSIDKQPVAYYKLTAEEYGENYLYTGYVPAILNGDTRVNLLVVFDSLGDGYLAGALPVDPADPDGVLSKTLIGIGKGDRLKFICDYYDYDGRYQDSYQLGEEITLGETVEIANTEIDPSRVRVTWRFTDIYQQEYWTPAIRGTEL